MPAIPKALERLVGELARLPGVGKRTAERFAFALLEAGDQQVIPLVHALEGMVETVGTCDACGYLTDGGECPLCGDPGRDDQQLIVVEHVLDVLAFEKAGGYRGRYHVLGGSLSPLKGVTPDDLRFGELEARLGGVTELILATSPSVEGDATALYIAGEYGRDGLEITRIGRGVPMGGSLELADGGTLRMALEGRRRLAGD